MASRVCESEPRRWPGISRSHRVLKEELPPGSECSSNNSDRIGEFAVGLASAARRLMQNQRPQTGLTSREDTVARFQEQSNFADLSRHMCVVDSGHVARQ